MAKWSKVTPGRVKEVHGILQDLQGQGIPLTPSTTSEQILDAGQATLKDKRLWAMLPDRIAGRKKSDVQKQLRRLLDASR